jgi:hypothetical protein
MSMPPNRAVAAAIISVHDRLSAGHVEVVVERITAKGPCGLAPALVEHIADRDVGAGLDHQLRGLRADAARCAGNQRHLAVEPVHCSPSF